MSKQEDEMAEGDANGIVVQHVLSDLAQGLKDLFKNFDGVLLDELQVVEVCDTLAAACLFYSELVGHQAVMGQDWEVGISGDEVVIVAMTELGHDLLQAWDAFVRSQGISRTGLVAEEDPS